MCRQPVAFAISSRHVGGNAGPNLNLTNVVLIMLWCARTRSCDTDSCNKRSCTISVYC